MKHLVILGLTLLLALLVHCGDDGSTCSRPDKPTAPCDPSPANGVVGVLDGIVLSWGCGECECDLTVTYDIHFGTDPEPPLVSRDFRQKRYNPGALVPGSHYYWQIVARNEVGSVAGELWDFVTEERCSVDPSAPCNPSPADGARVISVETGISWQCGGSNCGYAVSYDVYFGTAADPPLVCSGCSSSTYNPGTLSYATDYFWKVVASDSAGSTSGAVWGFTTEEEFCTDKPTAPCNPAPADEVTIASLETDLTWECGKSQCGLPVVYDVYFGTASDPPLVCSGCSTATYDPGTLSYATDYFWKVVASDSAGSTSGAVWGFTTEEEPCTDKPTAPCNPAPADEVTTASVETDLTWECGESQCGLPVVYDVYFGTESDPPLVCSDCSTATYDPGELSLNTRYSWKVVAKDPNGSTTGVVWHFTTRARSWHIRPDGTGDAPTISAGADSAASGDTLLLADGVYTGVGNRGVGVVNKRLTVKSESGNPEFCVVDCEGSGRFITFTGRSGGSASGLVAGIKIKRASTAIKAGWGARISVNNCILTANSSIAIIADGMPGQDYASINVSRSTFSSNPAGALYCGYKCGLFAGSCTFFNNGRILDVDEQGIGQLSRCTVAFNSVSSGGLMESYYSGFSINNSIIAFNSGNLIKYYPWCDVTLECSNVYGNSAGDYVGCLAGNNGVDGNISADPLFCDVASEVFTVEDCSPCLPGHHPDGYDCGEIIGALGQGCECGAATEPTTWGMIKMESED